MMIQVTTSAVHLKNGTRVEADGLKSFEFQINLENKLMDAVTRLVFLSAETGGGKTRGFTLPALKAGRNLIIVAPTNALIQDIRRNVELLIERMQQGGATVNHEVQVVTRYALYALNKRTILSGQRSRQGQALLQILANGDPGNPQPRKRPLILITNPDSLAVAMQMFYFQSEQILGQIINDFPWIVFDEFHAYTPKQIPAILYLHALIEMFASSNSTERKTVFSSATPTDKFKNALSRLLDLENHQIHHEIVVSSTSDESNRFQILQATYFTLTTYENDRDISALRSYIADHIAEIKDHLKIPNHRVCVIANSVFEASEIADLFRAEGLGEMLEEIRGFMSKGDRGKGQKAIVVGTSAIEMGVNFPISMLFTESMEGPSLIQRIGRLGRTQSSAQAIAHVLITPNVYDQLKNLNEKTLPRSEFRDKLLDSYPVFEDFWSYVRQFGLYENRYYIQRLNEYNSEQRTSKARSIGPRQATYFEKTLLPILAKAYDLDDWQAHLEWLDQQIADIRSAKEAVEAALRSTRGETIPMTCAIFDQADVSRSYFPFKTYDARLVLSRGDIIANIDPWEDEDKQKLPSWYVKAAKPWLDTERWEDHLQEIRAGYTDLFVKLNGLQETYTPIEYEAQTRWNWLNTNQLYAFPLRYKAENFDLMACAEMSNALEEKAILTFIIKSSKFRGSLRQEKNLPPLFEMATLYLLRGQGFQVAFGVNALYLWSKVLEETSNEASL